MTRSSSLAAGGTATKSSLSRRWRALAYASAALVTSPRGLRATAIASRRAATKASLAVAAPNASSASRLLPSGRRTKRADAAIGHDPRVVAAVPPGSFGEAWRGLAEYQRERPQLELSRKWAAQNLAELRRAEAQLGPDSPPVVMGKWTPL